MGPDTAAPPNGGMLVKPVLMVVGAVVLIAAGAFALNLRAAVAGGVQTPPDGAPAPEGSFFDLPATSLEGEPAPLSAWRGDVLLVVNTASKCGFTPQYAGLEKLYLSRKDRGFAVLGFPSNDFMQQEPGTPAEIRKFCTTKYDVTFPLFAKSDVKGDAKSEIYRFLTAGGLEEPSWNFTKYLVGRDGKVIARFGPRTTPEDPDLLKAIDAALAAPAPKQD